MKALIIRNYKQSYNNHVAELQLLIGLQQKGVAITLIGEGKEDNLKLLEASGIKIIRDFFILNSNESITRKLHNFIKESKFDILHLFIAKQMRIALPAVSKLPIKVIVYFGSSSLHWHDPTAYFTILNPRVDKIICNSKYVYQHVKRQLFGKNKNKAVRIYKGYGVEWFQDVNPYNFSEIDIPKDAIIITSVARNTKVKGVRYFLEAAGKLANYKNVHFIAIGSGTNNSKMQEIIAKFDNKTNIHLLGHRKDVIQLVKASDIYTQTSLSEGLGRAISEAMCLSKPIVMTDAGGCTELIENGKSGLIAPKKNPTKIAEAWIHLIENKELRIKMGQNAYNRMIQQFNIQTSILETYKLYQSLTIENSH